MTHLACDLRALAVFRVTLGLMVLGNMVGYAFASPTDTLPWLGAIGALLLSFGYQTRAMTLVAWVLLLGVNGFIREVPGESTRMLLALLFLGMFLPLGARYSVEYAMDPSPVAEKCIRTLATSMLTGQIMWFFVYAVWARFIYAAQSDARFEWHALVVAAIGVLALLPTRLFDRFALSVNAVHRQGLRMYFDGDCLFCRKVCLLFRTFFLLGQTPVLPAQEDPEIFAIMQLHDSWVVFDHNGKHSIRWHAVLLLLRRSLLMRPLGVFLRAIGMGRWGDGLYGAIAASRGWLSTVSAYCLPYRHQTFGFSRVAGVVLASWFAITVYSNIVGTQLSDGSRGRIAHVIVNGFAIDQNWRWLGSREPD